MKSQFLKAFFVNSDEDFCEKKYVLFIFSHLVANLELHFIKQQMEDSCSNKSTNMKLILLRVLLTNISSTLPATTTEHSWPKLLVYTLSDIKL